MSKKDVMRTLLFPEFVKNSYLIEEVKKECVDFDKLYSNAKLDLMLYVVSLENDGKTDKEIIEEVNTNIIRYAEEHVDANGLGTTLVCAVLSKDYLIFANVGDSSGFVFKSGKLYKVTKDHTLVNVLVESGELRPEEAENHPQKNVLMKALGAAENVDADIFDVETSVDGIFLCSDGLTNMVTKEQIERVLNDNTLDIEEKVDKLILKSNLRGGNDNISIAYLSREGVV